MAESSDHYVTPQEKAKHYISDNGLQQMFSSLLGALLLHRPDDPIAFIQTTLDKVKDVGAQNVNWETFVHDLHPYRHPLRLDLIQDDSPFQKERPATATKDGANKEAAGGGGASRAATASPYRSGVFDKTEVAYR